MVVIGNSQFGNSLELCQFSCTAEEISDENIIIVFATLAIFEEDPRVASTGI